MNAKLNSIQMSSFNERLVENNRLQAIISKAYMNNKKRC